MQMTTTEGAAMMTTATVTPFITEVLEAMPDAATDVTSVAPNKWHGVDVHRFEDGAEWVRLFADDPEGCRLTVILFAANGVELTRAEFTCGETARALTVEMAASAVAVMLEVLV